MDNRKIIVAMAAVTTAGLIHNTFKIRKTRKVVTEIMDGVSEYPEPLYQSHIDTIFNEMIQDF